MIDEEKLSELYPHMDHMLNITIMNIYSLAKRNGGKFYLWNFEYDRSDHKFFLEAALIAKRLGFCDEIIVVKNFFKTMRYNFKNKVKLKYLSMKKFKAIVSEDAPSTYEIISFMSTELNEKLPGVTFGDIYNIYFERK